MKSLSVILLIISLVVIMVTDGVAVVNDSCNDGESGECLARETEDGPAVETDSKCPDRDHIIRCAKVHMDKNQNGKLDRSELDEGKNNN